MTFTVRLATDDDGPAIERLVKAAGYGVTGIEWTGLYPYWLVVENGAGPVGCLQVCPGRPMGRLENLAVKADNPVEKARLVRMLAYSGMATLREGGSQLADFVIPFSERAYKKALKKRGATVIAQGNLMSRRLV